jgi:two-component system, sensor histidine kinase PdtaS
MKALVIISWITAICIFLQENKVEKELVTQNTAQEENANPSERIDTTSNSGIANPKPDQNEMVKMLYQKDLSDFEVDNDTLSMAKTHGRLALLFIQEDQLGKAESHLEMQGKLDSLIQNIRGLGFHFDQMGVVRSKQGFQEEAFDYFMKGLKIRESLDDPYELGESIAHVAQLLFEMKEYRKAIACSYRLLEVSEESLSLSQKETAYSVLARSYEAIRWFQAALDNQKNLKIISDSIMNQGFAAVIAKHESEIDLLEYHHNLEMAELRNLPAEILEPPKQDNLYPLLIALFFLICLLILVYFLRRKNLEQEYLISQSEEENRQLLKESHEKTQESLQLISSLLVLQDHDKVSGNGFNEGYGRAKTVALIGKSLDPTEKLTSVHAKGFLFKLCSGLFKTYQVKRDQVNLILEMDNISLEATTMVPLALIVHELVSNSLKYAFPGGQKGEIQIGLQEDGGRLRLRIEDDGKGFDSSQVRPGSIGFKIVNAMVNQLEGRLEIINQEGAKIRMEFMHR